MLMRFDPFRELERWATQPVGRPPVMPMDAYRHGDHLKVEFDLPGIDPSTVDLTVEKNVLTVTAQRTRRQEEDQEVLAAERPHGHFTRQLFLGEGLDLERIEARYEHGVLTVTIPIAEAAKPRKVEIETGASGGTAISAESKVA